MRRFSIGIFAMLVLASPAAAATRYATPSPAAGADCSQANPCSLSTALSGTVDGDTVQIASGTYGSAANGLPLGDLDSSSKAVTIEGVMGPARPTVYANGHDVTLRNPGSAVRDIALLNVGDLRVYAGDADRLLVDTVGIACESYGGTFTNSVCRSKNYGIVGSGGTTLARGVTAIAWSDTALQLNNGNAAVYNTILDGANNDTYALPGRQLSLVNSLGDKWAGNPPTITNGVTAAPVYRGPGDYRQGANAPTIDKGADDQSFGTYDLDGNLRKIGGHVDIGAYEQPPEPTLGAASVSGLTPTGATIDGTFDGKGGAVTYHVEYGPDATYGTSTPDVYSPGSASGGTLSVPLGGLTGGTTYHYRVVADSDGGFAATDDATFTTPFAAPTAGDVTVTDVTPTGARVSAPVDTDGADATAHFVVDGVALADIATSGGTVTQTLSGLASHHTHTVKLVVSSPGGTTESAVATFTTPYKGPAAGTITVSGVTASDAVVSAFVDTDGAAGTAHYVLDGVARPDIATSGGTITDRLTGLAAGRAHTVKLVVTTPAGTAESALDSFTTPAVVFKPTLTLGIGKGRAAGQLLLSRRTVTLFVRCGNVACQARATGTVTAGRKTLGRLRAPTKPITIAADTRGRLQPASSAALRRRVRAYLKAHKRAKVTIVLKGTFTGADGTTIVRRITINVRRLKR